MIQILNIRHGLNACIPTLGFARLAKENHRSLFTATTPDLFQVTPSLCGEPLKKKKRLDPAIVKAREVRKKKKIEKEIRKLEKNVLQFKPLEEMEVPSALLKDIEARSRPPPELTEEDIIQRHEIERQWDIFKKRQHRQDMAVIRRVTDAREKALEELKKESEELYFEAIKLDLRLIPFRCRGPVETPPIEDYVEVDGDYKDVSKKWE